MSSKFGGGGTVIFLNLNHGSMIEVCLKCSEFFFFWGGGGIRPPKLPLCAYLSEVIIADNLF